MMWPWELFKVIRSDIQHHIDCIVNGAASQNFRHLIWSYDDDGVTHIHNATTRDVRSGPKMSENAQFWGRMYFPTKCLRTYLQNHPQTPFGGPFNAKPIIQRALCQSHVNGATTLKLYGYIGIRKYLGCVKIFSLGGVWGAQGPLM